jgi:hypothetical protein
VYYYKITAENILRSHIEKLVAEIKPPHKVIASGIDPIFINKMFIIMQCDEQTATDLRYKIWALNDEASCNLHTISAGSA